MLYDELAREVTVTHTRTSAVPYQQLHLEFGGLHALLTIEGELTWFCQCEDCILITVNRTANLASGAVVLGAALT